jgi:hypothetical protein
MKNIKWRKSSYSSESGECIEFADLGNDTQAIRDSKNPTGPTLRFTTAAWATFTTGIHAGEFD